MNRLLSISILLILFGCSSKQADTDVNDEANVDEISLNSLEGLNLDKIQLPDGFSVDVYARVNNARSLVMTENGTLFVSNRGGDKVYALRDTNGDWIWRAAPGCRR